MTENRVYLDHNATTPLHPEVKKAMQDSMNFFGNPSSIHSFGRSARALVEEAREKVASLINARPEEVIFVGSGSEANNTVLSIITCPNRECSMQLSRGRGIVTTSIEHPCVLETTKCLQGRGVNAKFLEVDETGRVSPERLEELISDNIRIVSIMMANNEIGTLQDIGKLARIARENGVLFHTDAVQAVGKIPVDVKDLDVDFLTLSAHKIYGPKGVGALYVKKGAPFCPIIRGGHQELGRRAGTENTLGIVGLGKAAEMRMREMEEESGRLLKLKQALKKGIAENIPDIRFNGHPEETLHSTLNVSFEGAEGEAILLYLDFEGIAVSTGSACASGSLDPSHVLLATGLNAEQAHGSVRISFGRENTMEDVEYVLEKLPGVISRIRNMSTVYKRR